MYNSHKADMHTRLCLHAYTHIDRHTLIHSSCTHTHTRPPPYRVRHYNHSQKFVLNTYGYQVQRKPKGPSIRESYRNESDQNLYIQTPNVEMKDNDTEPMVSIPMSTLVEKEDEEEPEIFTNKAASESENGVSLSEDIVRELGEGHETQVLKMSFDEPGEETKL